MAGIVERSQSLKEESLSDLMTIVDNKSTPFMSAVKKGSAPKNSFVEWIPLDQHKANLVQTATYTSGISDNLPLDGADIDSNDFENYDDRTKCSVYLQYTRRVPKVSRLANMVSDVAGVGYKKEMANSIANPLVAHKRDIEATLCSSQETAQETSSAPYQTRGLGKWISSSAQSTLPVPADFRTPAGSIKSVAASSAVEEDLRGILQSIYEQTGESDKTFYGLCGTTMKKTISEFTLFTPRTNNLVVSNRDTDDNRLATAIDIIETDFGTIGLHLSSFLEQDARSSGAYDATVGQKTMFILNMSQLEASFAEETSVRELPDLGGSHAQLLNLYLA